MFFLYILKKFIELLALMKEVLIKKKELTTSNTFFEQMF